MIGASKMLGTTNPPDAITADGAKRGARSYLQYMGFEQTGTIRAYRFRQISPGEETREFIVTADLRLFVRYHVGIQEGPALCLRLLSAGARSSIPAAWPVSQSLSQGDLLAHLATHSAAEKAAGKRESEPGI